MKRRSPFKKVLITILIVSLLASAGYFTYMLINKGLASSSIYINEYLSANENSIVDEDGEHNDWIEIYNSSKEVINLKGYCLSDDENVPDKWIFPDVSLNPGSYLIVFASGKDRSDPEGEYLHTNFGIDLKGGETILFTDPNGEVVDKIKTVELPADVSYGRVGKRNNWLYFMKPTPGSENNTEGLKKLPFNDKVANPVVYITEVLPSNKKVLDDEDGNATDWIEIYNSSDKPLNLKGYALSDDVKNPLMWVFPDVEIGPKEYLIVFASGKDKKDTVDNLHTNFKINKSNEEVFFRDSDGKIISHITVNMLLEDISYGLSSKDSSKWVYYDEPTPGAANTTTEYLGIASEPVYVKPGGFYKDFVSVELKALEDGAEIRYTLDGSAPTRDSVLYTGPINIYETTVVRAASFKDGYLQRPVTAQTFFVNVSHTLPVVSIAIDPKDFDDPVTGMYSKGPNASSEFPYFGANFWQDWEKPASFELYEPDGKRGFGMNIGFKIFGGWTRGYDQKSFAIMAKNKFGGNIMNYKFLDNKDLTVYKNLVLRTAGQDVNKSKLRDILNTRLIQDTGLDYMGYRQTVLYINGKYWGIYNMREKINEHFIANNHGIEDVDAIDILEGQTIIKHGSRDEYDAMIDFLKNNDLSIKENYEKVKSLMDIQSYADFIITHMYTGNTDNGNIRYWKERKEGAKWRWIIYDMDMSFPNVDHDTVGHLLNPKGTGANNMFSTLITRKLLENSEFRQFFLERFAYHLKNTFKAERVVSIIDELAKNIESEIPKNAERWGNPSVESWESHVYNLKYFAERRANFIVSYLKKHLNLTQEELALFQ